MKDKKIEPKLETWEVNYDERQNVKLDKWGENAPNSNLMIEAKENVDFVTKMAYIVLKQVQVIREKHSEEIENGGIPKYTVKIPYEMLNNLGVMNGRTKAQYKKVVKSLFDTLMRIEPNENENTKKVKGAFYFPLYAGAYVEPNGIEILINPFAINYSKVIEKDYSSLPLQLLKPFKNAGTISLYNELKCHLDKHNKEHRWRARIELQELREWFGNEKSMLDWRNFRRKKLEPAIEKINEVSDIHILEWNKPRGCEYIVLTYCWNNNKKVLIDKHEQSMEELMKKLVVDDKKTSAFKEPVINKEEKKQIKEFLS